ncbi:MAG: hypothetical protein IJV38_07345 [Prevotella sp.]|nr:hypothetical protein [Prevotella sp.]
MKNLIEASLHDCEPKLEQEPEIVLSEADFERLVCWSIMNRLGHNDYQMPRPGDFTIHTQVSHYFDGIPRPQYRVDILLLTKEGMENASNQKEFIYRNDSFALELKYFHGNDTLSRIKEIKCDFCKRYFLDQNSWLYVVALIEEDDDDIYDRKKGIIDSIGYEEENGKDNLFHYVVRKRKVDWSKFKEPEQ